MLRILSVISLTCLLLAPRSLVAVQEVLPRVSPAAVGLSPEGPSEVTDLLTRFVEERQISGAVAGVARHGQLALVEADRIPGPGDSAPHFGAESSNVGAISRGPG